MMVVGSADDVVVVAVLGHGLDVVVATTMMMITVACGVMR
jgi:hypothetical protein